MLPQDFANEYAKEWEAGKREMLEVAKDMPEGDDPEVDAMFERANNLDDGDEATEDEGTSPKTRPRIPRPSKRLRR